MYKPVPTSARWLPTGDSDEILNVPVLQPTKDFQRRHAPGEFGENFAKIDQRERPPLSVLGVDNLTDQVSPDKVLNGAGIVRAQANVPPHSSGRRPQENDFSVADVTSSPPRKRRCVVDRPCDDGGALRGVAFVVEADQPMKHGLVAVLAQQGIRNKER